MSSTLWKYLRIVTLFFLSAPLLWADGSKQSFTLVIDAGHGGHDSGAVGAYSKEKDINLSVALAFGRLVAENCPDVKIIYTRSTDVFIPLQTRANIANKANADLFISIHTNALPNGRIAYGSETYSLGMARAKANLAVAQRENSVITLESDYKRTYEGFDPNKAESYVIFEIMQDKHMKQSVDLAQCIQKQYKSAGRPDKGVHQAGFLVLRNTSMPSVLTELGFITTPAEEAYLNSNKGVTELSRSIYNGFLAYRRLYDKTAHALPENLPSQVENDRTPSFSVAPPKKDELAVVPVETKPAQSSAKSKKEETATPAAKKEKASDKKAEQAAPKSEKATQTKTSTTTLTKKQTQETATTQRVAYHVQVGASKAEWSPDASHFNGLTVTCVKEGSMYKYYYGNYSTYTEAKQGLQEVLKKLKSAYIVAYVDGKLSNVTTARAIEKEQK